MMRGASKSGLVALVMCALIPCSGLSLAAEVNPDPLGGWHILQQDYDTSNPLDIISFEWDYYMVHDTGSGFSAILGYLVSNPRARLSDVVNLLPDGGNLAFVGQLPGQKPISHYVNFGLDHYRASAAERSFEAVEPQSGNYGTETPVPGGGPNGEDLMLLTGQTEAFEWDLRVYPEWNDRDMGYRPVHGTDVGRVPGEIFTVDVIWPRTRVQGTVRVRATGELLTIDTHGYRENAWGRYALTVDGWDFFVFSEARDDLIAKGLGPDQGLALALQTYHKSKLLDYTDVSFYDRGELKTMRFRAEDGQMGWRHPSWTFDRQAWQCVPTSMDIGLMNDQYRIDVQVTFPLEDQRPLLSNVTLPVAVYFIQDAFPRYEGKVRDARTGVVLHTFSGRGAGEFSHAKSARLWPAFDWECQLWGDKYFAKQLP